MTDTSSTYFKCDEPFKVKNHQIKEVTFSELDSVFVYSLFPKKKLSIIFPPIPNIKAHSNYLKRLKNNVIIFPTAINNPKMIDSSYFYDQHYHLNLCGNTLETQNMVEILQENITEDLR